MTDDMRDHNYRERAYSAATRTTSDAQQRRAQEASSPETAWAVKRAALIDSGLVADRKAERLADEER